MQYGSSVHLYRHQHRPVAAVDYKVHEARVEQMPTRLLHDSPPYADFNHKKPNSSKYKVDEEEEEEDADAKADEFIKGNHKHFGLVNYNQRPKFKVMNEEEEIVDAEAGEFIKHEHKMFLSQKTMASFR